MNIKMEKVGDTTARIIVSVHKEDIQPEVTKSFSRLRKNAVMPGFRKGNVPHSLLSAMYGKSILLEELNKWIPDKLSEYIKENNLILLGEPLLNANSLDLEHSEEYEFIFDVGLQPEIRMDLTKEYKFSYYNVRISDEMIEKQIHFLRNQFGHHNASVDCIEKEDRVKGLLTELDQNGIQKEEGLNLKEVVLIPLYIKDDEEKAKFIGRRVGETVLFNPHKAFGESETALSYFLHIKKGQVKNYTGDFLLTVSEINRYQPAEIGQKLFDRIYGEGVVSSEEAFREKIKENLVLQWNTESDYRLLLEAQRFLLEKIQQVQFPEDFLKSWWRKNHSEIDPETVEKDFPGILKKIKTQCIWSKIIEENGLTVNSEEVRQAANIFVRSQFSLYRLLSVADSIVENHANELLKTEDGLRQLHGKALEIKIIQCLKEKTTLNFEMITEEEFRKLPE